MNLYEILVPTIMDGKPIRLRYHKVWDSKVREISNGLTIMSVAKGHWISREGKLFTERMIPVRIGCTEKQFEKILDLTAKYYKQEAIFYAKLSNEAKVVHYDTNSWRRIQVDEPSITS